MGKKLNPWENWSPTKMDLLLFKCPLSFCYEYVQGMQNEVPQNILKLFGSAIHRMLKTFFTLKNGYKSLEKFINAWIYYWLEYTLIKKYGTRVRIIGSDDAQKYLAIGINILKKFYHENLPYRTGELPEPLVEKRLSIEFKSHRITGRIDRIQPVEGGVEIWDYKTGYKKPSKQELLRNAQFTFYNLIWLKKTGQNPIKMRLCQLSTAEQYIIAPRSESDYVQLGQWLDEATIYVKNILEPKTKNSWNYFSFRLLNPEDIERKHFSPRPSSFCTLCDYEELCREHKPKDELREWWVRQELKKTEILSKHIPSAFSSLFPKQLDLHFPKKKISLR